MYATRAERQGTEIGAVYQGNLAPVAYDIFRICGGLLNPQHETLTGGTGNMQRKEPMHGSAAAPEWTGPQMPFITPLQGQLASMTHRPLKTFRHVAHCYAPL